VPNIQTDRTQTDIQTATLSAAIRHMYAMHVTALKLTSVIFVA